MFSWIKKSLMSRLVILFFLTVLIPIAVVSSTGFHLSKKALVESYAKALTTAGGYTRVQVNRYLKNCMVDLNMLATSREVQLTLGELDWFKSQEDLAQVKGFDVTSEQYAQVYKHITPFFTKYLKLYGYYDVFLISRDHGRILYTASRQKDLGTNLETGLYRDSGLAQLWAKVLRTKKPAMVDLSLYTPTGKPSLFIGAPVLDGNGQARAVVVLQLSLEQIEAIVHESESLGHTGDIFLVGQDHLMRSGSRLSKGKKMALKQKVDTPAVRQALNGKRGTIIVKGLNGNDVLCSYAPLGLKKSLGTDFEWAIVAQMNSDEIMAPVKAFKYRSIWIAVVLAILACLLGFFFARSIAHPITKLSEKLALVIEGDLTVEIPETERMDEIGNLLRSFKSMIESLRKQTREIVGGLDDIASSISQLSATSTELASGAAETSSSISEISATVEEIRQTTHSSNEMARQMSESAEKTANISEEGKKATGDAVDAMEHIRDEVAYVAENTVKLSEQSQSIGEIIAAVKDIADQSNLLSVNASIEAAKAGEHGKGFAVVAQEVRSLADQSKEATTQVEQILKDIQKATSTAVMATERGNKAVETGVVLAKQAGDTINVLSGSVTQAAQHALQIAASSREQLVGIDQLALAMENMKKAGTLNAEGAKQLEEATKVLQHLAGRLKQHSDRFKV